ncbi:MAG: NmrA family NAD(P)-binding protein, partial [Gammaproteobacteria bacterium]|nr:NmrA family NAD(P)-binding protein [Gammaproteobacteria bacterium]
MRRLTYILITTLASLLAAACGDSDSPTPDTRKIVLVTGATGTQGGAVARELAKRGYVVRGLTRNADSERATA